MQQLNEESFRETMKICSQLSGKISDNIFTSYLEKLYTKCKRENWSDIEAVKEKCLKEKKNFIKQVERAIKKDKNPQQLEELLTSFELNSTSCIGNLTDFYEEKKYLPKERLGGLDESDFD